ncbi:MAG TPA: hypothetical protein VI749_06610 [Candidatus Omnitrophota bacterium]|nr:hypothetical protein [Candidatus Omnitrophota bacterium]
MQNKYYRIFVVEKQYRVKMITAGVLFVLIIIVNALAGAGKKGLAKVKAEKEFVMNIPIMEKLIASKTQQRVVRPVEVEEGPLNLEGTFVQNGITYALINGTVLSKGDILGDYVISNIEFGVAVLDNLKTKERKILQFFYYE